MPIRRKTTKAPPTKAVSRKSPAKSQKKVINTKAVAKKSAAKPAKTHPVSPLAPKSFANLPPLAGVRLATGEAGVRYHGRPDVLLSIFAPGTGRRRVYKSKTASAPVDWCKAQLPRGSAGALVVNSGNANAFTGKAGAATARAVADSAAAIAGCRPGEVFLASTGVIGEQMAGERITAILPGLAENCAAGGWRGAAEAIMTTDTYPKLATATAEIDGYKVTLNGIAKGSGMIAPDMATMLAFVFTDANLPAAVLQSLLSEAAPTTFNAITVDSDTSTSDTVLMFATAKVPSPGDHQTNDRRLGEFREKLHGLLLNWRCKSCAMASAQKLIRRCYRRKTDAAHAQRHGDRKLSTRQNCDCWRRCQLGPCVMAVGKAGKPTRQARSRSVIRWLRTGACGCPL